MLNSREINPGRIVSLYADAPLATRCFLRLRQLVTPYEQIAASFPRDGKMLDLGCGHGLFSFTLALAAYGREVTGVDHDSARIHLARAASKRLGVDARLTFEVRDLSTTLASVDSESLSGVAMIDMLHYFDADAQEALVRDAHRVLKKNGILAVREIDSGAGVNGRVNRLYERAATGTGFTRSSSAQLTFRTASEWSALLRSVGLAVEQQPCGLPFLADVLFVGRRIL